MKIIRLAAIAIAISLTLATFAPVGASRSFTANTSAESSDAAALGIPSPLSPFVMAASAPLVSIITEAAPAGYACKLMAQTPADWTRMRSRQIFDTYWTLKNTGTKDWGIHGVDVKYRGGFPEGTNFHTSRSLFDLPRKTGPGQRITLGMDFIAPKKAGYYVSNWGLYVGSQVFCKFYIAITVTG